MYKYALLVTMLMLSSVATASNQTSREQLAVTDLQRQLLSAEVITIPLPEGSFSALQRENLTPYNKGTAILVPDWSEHAASPRNLDYLRQQLNEYGWNTLSIMVPDALYSADQLTTGLTDYRQQLQQRMQASIQQAENQPGAIIVIAQGSSAALLSELYSSGQLSEPAALILLGAYLPDEQLNRQLALRIATQKAPTLDIHHPHDNRFVISQLKLRQQLAHKHLKVAYRQRQLPATSHYHQNVQYWLLKEIHGWLHTVGL